MMMMAVKEKRKRRSGGSILSVLVLLSMTSLMEAGTSNCTTSAADVGSSGPSPSAVLDLKKAELSQRQHLEALFHRLAGAIPLIFKP